jgi:hypothetical protein
MFAAYDAGSVIEDLKAELNRTAEEQKEQTIARLMHDIDISLSIYQSGKSTTPDRLDQTWMNCVNLFDAEYNV